MCVCVFVRERRREHGRVFVCERALACARVRWWCNASALSAALLMLLLVALRLILFLALEPLRRRCGSALSLSLSIALTPVVVVFVVFVVVRLEDSTQKEETQCTIENTENIKREILLANVKCDAKKKVKQP